MPIECYFDEAGCLTCPEIQATPFHPAVIEPRPVRGWDAGARSRVALDGNMSLKFTMPPGSSGVVLGLRYGTAHPDAPDLIAFGFYFTRSGSGDGWCIWERGVQRTTLAVRTDDTTFEVRRVDGKVSYLVDNAVVLVSALASAGAMYAGTALYASGDKVPA